MKVYLAGPMRGYPNFNFPAFKEATTKLREEGYEVFSPAEKDIEKYGEDLFRKTDGDQAKADSQGFNLREALAMDLEFICKEAEGIFMLPGWEKSKGATAEKAIAEALGLWVKFL